MSSMKRIAITGSSSGIGLGLVERFRALNWEIIPLSRTEGTDVLREMESVLSRCRDVDVFVNCAYLGFYNVDLLYRLHELWKDDEKTIINIGSDSADGTKSFVHPYAVAKAALAKACEQLQNTGSRCRVVHLKPGYVDTPRVAKVDARKLDVADVVRAVEWCLSQPDTVYVREISLRAREARS